MLSVADIGALNKQNETLPCRPGSLKENVVLDLLAIISDYYDAEEITLASVVALLCR